MTPPPGSDLAVQYSAADLDRIQGTSYTPAQLITIAGAVARSNQNTPPTIDELQLLAYVQQSTNLDWFKGEIGMASFRQGAPLQPYFTWKGLFTLTSRVVGITRKTTEWRGPGKDDPWEEFWLDDQWGPPAVARVMLWIEGVKYPVSEVAAWGAWAKGTWVEEEIPDPNGGTVDRCVDLGWVPDPSGATWTADEVRRKGWAQSKIGKPKMIKGQEWRKVPATIFTGRKVLKPTPDSPWETNGSHMLMKCAARLACETALRISGKDERAIEVVESAGIIKLRNWAFALVKELGREGDDDFRAAMSEGRSWAAGVMDIEEWVDTLTRLREKVDEHRVAQGRQPVSDAEMDEAFSGVEEPKDVQGAGTGTPSPANVGKGAPGGPTPASGGADGAQAPEAATSGTTGNGSEPQRAATGTPAAPAATSGESPEPTPSGEAPAVNGSEDGAAATDAAPAESSPPTSAEGTVTASKTVGGLPREIGPPPSAPQTQGASVRAGVSAAFGDPAAEGPADSGPSSEEAKPEPEVETEWTRAYAEYFGEGGAMTVTREVLGPPIEESFVDEAPPATPAPAATSPDQATPEQIAALTALARKTGKPGIPDPETLSWQRAENLIALWTRHAANMPQQGALGE